MATNTQMLRIDVEFAVRQASVIIPRHIHIPKPGKYHLRDFIQDCSHYSFSNDVNLQIFNRCAYNGLIISKNAIDTLHKTDQNTEK
jgi:hypothetical protein